MPNAEKISAVAEITEHFNKSAATVITEYRGLSVKQVTQLRRSLGRETTYAIVKNTLTKRAAADAGIAIDESLLVGPTAIAFVGGDPVEAAKGLRDFAKANPSLVIKAGIFDGNTLSAAEIGRIADLESREVLLSKLAGAIKALPTRAASLFQAPLTQMALLAKALEDKKSADSAPAEASVSEQAGAGAVGQSEPPAEPAAPAAEVDADADADATDSAVTSAAEDPAHPTEGPAEPAE